MVQVAVRVEVPNWAQFVAFNKGFYLCPFRRSITARINNNTFTGFIIQNIGVFRKRVELEDVDLGNP